MTTDIIDIHVGSRPIAAVRLRTTIAMWSSQFGRVLGTVYEALRAGNAKHLGINVMVYRHRADGQVDIECGVEVVEKFEDISNVVYSETPTGDAVTAAHIGPYTRLGQTHDAIVDWCRGHGRKLTGVCWEVYGHWNEDESKLRTDIFQLIGK